MNVGFTSRIVFAENYKEERDALSHDWIKFSESIGATPVLIPNNLVNVGEFISETSLIAIFLTGGGDCPSSIDDFDKSIDKKRNETELKVIEFCINNHIPLIGVCRGFQIINIFFGGTLTRNIIDHEKITKDHVNSETKVKLLNLGLSEKSEDLNTNVKCFHDDGIISTDLCRDLIPFATAENGNLIEAYKHKNLPIMGIQWHPEREATLSGFNKNLITNFFQENIQ